MTGKDDSYLHSDERALGGSHTAATVVLEVSRTMRSQFLFISDIFLCQLNQPYEYMAVVPCPLYMVTPRWGSYSPYSSRCCTRPGTCRSPQFSPAGSPLPGSSGWPGHGAQSVGTPGRPCRLQFAERCEASETESAQWAECLPPSAPRPARVPCGRIQEARASAGRLEGLSFHLAAGAGGHCLT